jgi:vancomycin resistance protein VanW
MLKRPGWIAQPLSTYHPALYHLARWIRQTERTVSWSLDGREYSGERVFHDLPARVKKHQSVLIRKLGDSDVQLQKNKVENLKIVVSCLDGLLIRPGETFSFCKLVGRPTRSRGFLEGMELVAGEARPGVGGGMCQASNLLFWLALHSPLSVIERHHHSFDPFPDQGRVLPFASGATVMFNYRDLRFENRTPHTFQLRLWMDKKCLNGDLRCSERLRHSYKVFERNHRYECVDGEWFRGNELWRRVVDKDDGGKTIKKEFLFANFARVKYEPSQEDLAKTTSVPHQKPVL